MSVTLGRVWLYLFDFLVIISLSPHLQKYIKMSCHLKSPGERERVSVFQCSFLTSLPWNQKSLPWDTFYGWKLRTSISFLLFSSSPLPSETILQGSLTHNSGKNAFLCSAVCTRQACFHIWSSQQPWAESFTFLIQMRKLKLQWLSSLSSYEMAGISAQVSPAPNKHENLLKHLQQLTCLPWPRSPDCVQIQLTSRYPGLAGSLMLCPCVRSSHTCREGGQPRTGSQAYWSSAASLGWGPLCASPSLVHV